VIIPWAQLDNGGFTSLTQPTMLTTIPNAVAIAAGYQFTLAVTSNGNVYAWGDNSFGELGTNVTAGYSTNLPVVVAASVTLSW